MKGKSKDYGHDKGNMGNTNTQSSMGGKNSGSPNSKQSGGVMTGKMEGSYTPKKNSPLSKGPYAK